MDNTLFFTEYLKSIYRIDSTFTESLVQLGRVKLGAGEGEKVVEQVGGLIPLVPSHRTLPWVNIRSGDFLSFGLPMSLRCGRPTLLLHLGVGVWLLQCWDLLRLATIT